MHKMLNIEITKMDGTFESQTESVESTNHRENFQLSEVTDKCQFCDRNQCPIPESKHWIGKLSFFLLDRADLRDDTFCKVKSF